MDDQLNEFWKELVSSAGKGDSLYPHPADKIRAIADLLENPKSTADRLINLIELMKENTERETIERIELDVKDEIRTKDQIRRRNRLLDLTNQMIGDGKPLGFCDTAEGDCNSFLKLEEHIESLWHDSATLFNCGSYSTAVFISIACMEELGKLAVASHQLFDNELRRRGLSPQSTDSPKRGKSSFYMHDEKQILAVYAGTLVNRKLDGILSMEKVDEFIKHTEEGELEVIRQTALYSELEDNIVSIPKERITEETARFFITLCGEILIKIGKGFDPPIGRRAENMVRRFKLRLIDEGR